MKRELMSLAKLKEILAARGFSLALREGVPFLRGKSSQATPALMRVLAFYRDVLIAELKGVSNGE